MLQADQAIAENILSHQIDLFRLSAHAQSEAVQLLENMGKELEAKLRSENLTELTKARLNKLLSEANAVIAEYYAKIAAKTESTLSGIASVQANVVTSALETTLGISIDAQLPPQNYLAKLLSNTLIEGAQTATWWGKQEADTKFKFTAAVRQGLVAGETNYQIVSRIVGTPTAPGVLATSRSNANALVHASVQAVANSARRETFQQNSDVIKGIRQVSTFDSHTTPVCIAYNGAQWNLEYEPINGTKLPYNGGVPRHWGCRSVEVPITKGFKELGLDIPEMPVGHRASTDGAVSANMTMKQFLDTRTDAQLNEQLGVGRAKLYSDGKITLQQLLDQRGNPLTLSQLIAKYG